MAHVYSTTYFQSIIDSTPSVGTGRIDLTLGDIGTGSDRTLVVGLLRRDDRMTAISGAWLDPTTNNEALTIGAEVVVPSITPAQAVGFACITNPISTGSGLTLRVEFTSAGSGNTDAYVTVTVIDGIGTQDAPTATTNTGETATSAVTESSATGNQIITQHFMVSDATPDGTGDATNFTRQADGFGGGYEWLTGTAAGAASVAMSYEFQDTNVAITGDLQWVAASYDFAPPSVTAGSVVVTSTSDIQ